MASRLSALRGISITSALLTTALGGCTVIGTGRNTIILAQPQRPAVYQGVEFSDLIATDARKIVPGKGTADSESVRWETYKARNLGVSAGSVSIDVNVRNQSVTPALDTLNIEVTNAGDIARIMADGTTSVAQKEAAVAQLRNNYRRMPEAYPALVSRLEMAPLGVRGESVPVTVYHYFPKVTLDLTGELLGAANLDRIDFLAVSVRLTGNAGVRFTNFSPKTADLFDFTLGSLKQSASATGSITAGQGSSRTDTDTTTDTGSSAVDAVGRTGTLGGSLSATMSDEFTRDLRSSLDTRSAGIVEGGRVFIIALRSNDQKRISGTYSYTVMLDVPSLATRTTVSSGATYIVSDPVEKLVQAEIRVVGLVRHVEKRGKTGTFKRVPEPLNDDTFDQVVLVEKLLPLWEMQQPSTLNLESSQNNLTIYTNETNATFTVYSDDPARTVLKRGGGRETRLFLPESGKVDVVFDPINVNGKRVTVLSAAARQGVTVSKAGETVVVGQYAPISEGEK